MTKFQHGNLLSDSAVRVRAGILEAKHKCTDSTQIYYMFRYRYSCTRYNFKKTRATAWIHASEHVLLIGNLRVYNQKAQLYIRHGASQEKRREEKILLTCEKNKMPNNLAIATAVYGFPIHEMGLFYDLPMEVIDKILAYLFQNRIRSRECDIYRRFKLRSTVDLSLYNYKPLNLYNVRISISYIRFRVSNNELKATLKELIKANNLKIPISRLKKNELINILIHTEFSNSESIEAYTRALCPNLQ